jgi:hypothetical protein
LCSVCDSSSPWHTMETVFPLIFMFGFFDSA